MNPFKTRLLSVFLLVSLLLTVFPVSGVQAAGNIIHVTAEAPSGPIVRKCAGTWDNPCGLQQALSRAVAGDQIWVAAGTYQPTTGTDRAISFALKNGVAIYGGFTGNETALEQRDPFANVTILSGEIGTPRSISDNSYHVVSSEGLDSTAILDGFTIAEGNADGPTTGFDTWGGGMFLRSGSATLTNIIFRNNRAASPGGGMASIGNPILTNITFSGNSAIVGGGMHSVGNATLTNITFHDNAARKAGGGMSIHGSPILTNITFSGNTIIEFGGGLYNSGSPTLTNVTFSGNRAADPSWGQGGALYDDGNAVIQNSILWGNSAPTGPQVFVSTGGTTSLSDSVVEGGCPVGSTCSNLISGSPRLGMLGSNGGFTQTIPLRPGSSAIDTGDNAFCPATDQRGVARPQASGCDIGAYEVLEPVGEGLYDDNHPAWLYHGDWTLAHGTGTYDDTLHRTNTKSSAQVVFNGIAVQLTYGTGPDHGSIVVYMDGKLVDAIDANAERAGQAVWKSSVQSPGVHTVGFVTAAGQWIDVDAIQVFAPDGVGPGTYDDTDPAWSYTGNWVSFNGSGPYNNTLHYTDTVGGSAELVFHGSQFTLTYAKASNRGSIDVYVDGTKIGTIIAYSASTLWQRTWTSPSFTAGDHTVRFVHAGGGTYIDIDAIVITP